MGNILEFPSEQAKGLAFLDRQIRQLLTSKGADDELIDFAAQQLTRIYKRIKDSEQYCFGIRLPEGLSEQKRTELKIDIDAGLETIRKENHGLMIELVAQLVLAQVQIFQLQRD
ncbi:MAG: hypothetical protein P8L70_11410 [Halioglobus sp.]|jgi:hypothetical protein|nr:hypothetical protein GPB2148_972 [marine gamma proteobacterium HTCC2148]MBT3411366.1 hypothetical protein [Halieaceae bacterium]MDG1387373.1 hypothetical protein [Halioglobus sp.]MBT6125245.1 hypothetical protein [Halieaceae bacterium]MBT7718078.1 hypothetical protein [Halieaceae bacterium]